MKLDDHAARAKFEFGSVHHRRLFGFSIALQSALPNGQIDHRPRIGKCGLTASMRATSIDRFRNYIKLDTRGTSVRRGKPRRSGARSPREREARGLCQRKLIET